MDFKSHPSAFLLFSLFECKNYNSVCFQAKFYESTLPLNKKTGPYSNIVYALTDKHNSLLPTVDYKTESLSAPTNYRSTT